MTLCLGLITPGRFRKLTSGSAAMLLARVYPTFALAEGIHLPALRVDRRTVDDVAGAVALPRVPGADVADGWDDL